MDYTPDDYKALFGDDAAEPKPWTFARLTLLAVLLGVILAPWGIAGCDFQAAQATEESIKAAEEKSQAVLGHPCLYVAQCSRINQPCDVEQRHCVNSDLRNIDAN